MTQVSLERAAGMVLMADAPQDRQRPTAGTRDATRKTTRGAADSPKAPDFLGTMTSQPPIFFPDPIYPSQQILLRARRDLEPDPRLLLAATRRSSRRSLAAAVTPEGPALLRPP
ncbi:unnamed protein product [Prorocentrum cordatum]|uniref:Uncharacterized protein n=1 Tax=Prorocentrum cordatum TaxID=2364126 RepID=A0ABN9YGA9_9DINO|nr:unnamed protein product [Polarella glacialis]